MTKALQEEHKALPTEMRRLLMEIGLMGYGGGLPEEAELLFQKLRIADPTAAYPLLALAQIHIYNKDPLQAEQLLLELEFSHHANDPMVRGWIQDTRKLGIAFAKALADSSQQTKRS